MSAEKRTAILRALDMTVTGISIHESFYRRDAKEAAALIREQNARIEALEAALREIAALATSDMDEQAYIANAALPHP